MLGLVACATVTCSKFVSEESATNDGGAAPDASQEASPDGAPPVDAGPFCDGGHAFCVDFDDTGASYAVERDWTTVTSTSTSMTFSGAPFRSPPNALHVSAEGGPAQGFLRSKNIALGGPLTKVILSHALHPRAVAPFGNGDTIYVFARLFLYSASDVMVGLAWVDWNVNGLTLIVNPKDGGNTKLFGEVAGALDAGGGPLGVDDWVTEVLIADFNTNGFSAVVRDKDGMQKAMASISGGFDFHDVSYVAVEVGPITNELGASALDVSIDDIVVDFVP